MGSSQNGGTALSEEMELANRLARSLERFQRKAIPSGMSSYLHQQAKIMDQLAFPRRGAETALKSNLAPLLQQAAQLQASTGPVVSVPAENYTAISRALETALEFEPEIETSVKGLTQEGGETKEKDKKVSLEWLKIIIDILAVILALYQVAGDVAGNLQKPEPQKVIVLLDGFDCVEKLLEENSRISPPEVYDAVQNPKDLCNQESGL